MPIVHQFACAHLGCTTRAGYLYRWLGGWSADSRIQFLILQRVVTTAFRSGPLRHKGRKEAPPPGCLLPRRVVNDTRVPDDPRQERRYFSRMRDALLIPLAAECAIRGGMPKPFRLNIEYRSSAIRPTTRPLVTSVKELELPRAFFPLTPRWQLL